MTSRENIRAVFADPGIEGMTALYAAIGKQLHDGIDFERAYASIVQTGGEEAKTWIRFCVRSATRFEQQPLEEEFLAVLEEFSRQSVG